MVCILDSKQRLQSLPNRENITYYVYKVKNNVELVFTPVIERLRLMRRNTLPRIIVYCRSVLTCSKIYKLFDGLLGPDSYYPVGTDDLRPENRLFEMFHHSSIDENKEVILNSL